MAPRDLAPGTRGAAAFPALAGPVAVLGYGNQGEAQALNLRDGGHAVVVGARPGGGGERRARAAGFETLPVAEAAARAAQIAVTVPDEALPETWPAIAAALEPGATVVFAHGFNLVSGAVAAPAAVDVVLVAPCAPGRVLRESFRRGERVPGYVAVHHDASGGAEPRARAWGAAIGLAPLWPTTVREETEVDLFGEQVVLCGGLTALVAAAFETLAARGYPPEIAYLECVHQVRYLAELLSERGPAGFREAISGTARYGDLTRGPRVIGPESRRAMEAILEEVRSGAFAREWRDEVAAGTPRLAALLESARRHPLESARRRALGAGGNPATHARETD